MPFSRGEKLSGTRGESALSKRHLLINIEPRDYAVAQLKDLASRIGDGPELSRLELLDPQNVAGALSVLTGVERETGWESLYHVLTWGKTTLHGAFLGGTPEGINVDSPYSFGVVLSTEGGPGEWLWLYRTEDPRLVQRLRGEKVPLPPLQEWNAAWYYFPEGGSRGRVSRERKVMECLFCGGTVEIIMEKMLGVIMMCLGFPDILRCSSVGQLILPLAVLLLL